MAVAACVVLGCGSRPAGSPNAINSTSSTSSSCAAELAAVPVGTSCREVGATCAYPDGQCHCGPASYCGGVEPDQALLDELAVPRWQCTPARTDGCSETEPSGACTEEGKACMYGACCVTLVTCTDGAWVAGDKQCPP